MNGVKDNNVLTFHHVDSKLKVLWMGSKLVSDSFDMNSLLLFRSIWETGVLW
jgi:hypothetical protein